jgi:hypothetical protein
MPNIIELPTTFNNGLLHCLALHCVLTKQPLPSSLFDLQGSALEPLSTFFQDESSFNLYFEKQLKIIQTEGTRQDLMLEKALILQMLFRRYYATQLKKEPKDAVYYSYLKRRFVRGITRYSLAFDEAQGEQTLDALLSANEGLLFKANKVYIQAYLAEQKRLERGEEINESDRLQAPTVYFDETGCDEFIRAIEDNENLLQYTDIRPLTDMLDVSLTISDEKESHDPEKLELVLRDGEYALKLEDGEVADSLQRSIVLYQRGRGDLLSIDEPLKQVKHCEELEKTCLFLSVTLPCSASFLPDPPFNLLIGRLDSLASAAPPKLSFNAMSALTDAYLDAQAAYDFSLFEDQFKWQLVTSFLDNNTTIDKDVTSYCNAYLREGGQYSKDEVVEGLLGDTRSIEGIRHGVEADYTQCVSTEDYIKVQQKYAFLQASYLDELAILRFYQELIVKENTRFERLISQLSDNGLKESLYSLYRELHGSNLSFSEKLMGYQLVLNTFSPLNQTPPNIPLFEQRLARFENAAKTMKGHARLGYQLLGAAMLGVVFAVGIALSVGTLGLGVGCVGAVGSIMMSMGFFSLGQPRGFSKAITQISKHANKAPSLVDKLNLVLGDSWLLNAKGHYYCQVNDINEGKGLAKKINRLGAVGKIKAEAKIVSEGRYTVELKGVTYDELKKIEKQSLPSSIIPAVSL